jgi:hypothetical protein
MQYAAYLDESYVNASRYRSIACCSVNKRHLKQCEEGLAAIIAEHRVKEFKWSKLKDRRMRDCGLALLDFVIAKINFANLRIDVLTWDTHDRRHEVRHRDDSANYERMFFHLLAAALRRRGVSASWWIQADQRDGVDWATIHDCLVARGRQPLPRFPILDEDYEDLGQFRIESFMTVDSEEAPLTQVADLFAGLAVFSGDNYPEYEMWSRDQAGQADLFAADPAGPLTNRQRYRFEVLAELDRRCKQERLGVSLKTNQRLWTFDGRKPINFWLYQPQHDGDKAPVKGGRAGAFNT